MAKDPVLKVSVKLDVGPVTAFVVQAEIRCPPGASKLPESQIEAMVKGAALSQLPSLTVGKLPEIRSHMLAVEKAYEAEVAKEKAERETE